MKDTASANDKPPSITSAILDAVNRHVVEPAGEIVDSTFLHGPVAAALRQGADEIGMALKAFPDSIQTHEPGSVLNPLFSDIANNRRADAFGTGPDRSITETILSNPQDFLTAEQKQNGQEHQQQHDQGREH
jgi:hypothetical protein